jgi:hypothetical protein
MWLPVCGISHGRYCELHCSLQLKLVVPCSSVLQRYTHLSRNASVPHCIHVLSLIPNQAQPGQLPPLRPWEGPVNSLCQLLIILMANTFLASRLVDSWSTCSHQHILTRLLAFTGLPRVACNVVWSSRFPLLPLCLEWSPM